jgi:hypothetical protein
MNARTQVTLEPEMQRRAQAKATDLGISLSEYVRCPIAKDLGEPDISIIFDLATSGEPTNIARDKDKMIGEAVWEEYLRDVGRKPRRQSRTRTSRR